MNNIIIILLIILLIILIIFYFTRKNSSDIFTSNCLNKRFGCCNDEITPKLDQIGTNCRGF